MVMSEYDSAYGTHHAWFGNEPDPLLTANMDRVLALPGTILDLGAGQGRHCLPLARMGKTVVAVDPSGTSIEQIQQHRREGDLQSGLTLIRGGFQAISRRARFDAVLLFGLIQELPRHLVRDLAGCCRSWCGETGMVLITAFTTDDPAFPVLKGTAEMKEKNSFCTPGGAWKTFLEPGELVELFPGFRSAYCREFMGAPHRHGNGPMERHARIEALLVPEGADNQGAS